MSTELAARPDRVTLTLPRRRVVLALPRESTVVAVLLGVGYLAIAAWLALSNGLIIGDALSRVGNAYYMAFSRDPHIAAVGFVWNPLPSVLELPLLPFSAIWPDLTRNGFAANLLSVACVALAVRELLELGRDLGLPRPARLLIALLFALHPMVVYYAANGMSEGPFMLFLLMAIRRLTAWMETASIRSLALAGIALGLAYLCRYEALAAGLGAAALVFVVSAWRSLGVPRDRLEAAGADVVVLLAPFAMCVGGWALASWLIVGNPFETFSSAYGNTAQVQLSAGEIASATGKGTLAQLLYAWRQLLGLQPGILVIGFVTAAVAVLRRDARFLAPGAILGAVLAFGWYALLTGKSFGWLRFEISVVPLAITWAAMALAGLRRRALAPEPPPLPGPGAVVAPDRGPIRWRPLARLAPAADTRAVHRARGPRALAARGVSLTTRAMAALMLVTSLAYAVPSSITTMLDPVLSREESVYLSVVLPNGERGTARTVRGQFAWSWGVAAWLDPLGLPDGAVLVDGATAFPLVLRSEHPRQFVITSDRDFRLALSAPAAFGVRYILVPPDCQALDGVRRKYPGLWENGAGIAMLAAEFPTVDGALGCNGRPWRLYKIKATPAG